ncbi:hypothetical protein KS407_20070 [Bacillus alkalicola]|uniref:SCP domain-containing protein n=2 Tax=Bacillales TaxID=1385 RepID=A0ABS6K274_9BACI|nr:hypothetical protein [Bacillus alkalicola]
MEREAKEDEVENVEEEDDAGQGTGSDDGDGDGEGDGGNAGNAGNGDNSGAGKNDESTKKEEGKSGSGGDGSKSDKDSDSGAKSGSGSGSGGSDGNSGSGSGSGSDSGSGSNDGSKSGGDKGNKDASKSDSNSESKEEAKPKEETKPKSSGTSPNASQFEQEVLSLVNDIRKADGLAAFKTDGTLSAVARTKSEDMRDNKYFSHTSPTYGSPFDMMAHYGLSYSRAGENIAGGQASAAAVVDSWMNSDGHRANILNGDFTHMGVGYASGGDYRHYWTQLFMTR